MNRKQLANRDQHHDMSQYEQAMGYLMADKVLPGLQRSWDSRRPGAVVVHKLTLAPNTIGDCARD